MTDPNADFALQFAQQPTNPVAPGGGDPNAEFAAQVAGYGMAQSLHPQTVTGMWDALKAGAETSTAGLLARGKNPDLYLGENPTRTERLTYMAAQALGDLPTYVLGALGGAAAGTVVEPGVGTLVGGGAGGMGLTQGARTWMLEQYKQGADRSSLADRIAATAWAATKGAITGGVMGPAGKIVGKVAPIAATPAELATMTTVSSALEGHLPQPQDFIDGAIMLGGFHVGAKGASMISAKLAEIYRQTGKTPQEVLQEAAVNPQLHEQIVDPNYDAIPDQLQPLQRPVEPQAAANELIQYPFPGSRPDEPTFPELARNVPDMETAQLLQTRLSEQFEQEYRDAKGGQLNLVARAQAAVQEMRTWLGGDSALAEMNIPAHVTGTAENFAQILARRTMLFNSYVKAGAAIKDAIERDDDEGYAGMLSHIEGIRLQEKWLSGASAEASRAFAAFQKKALDVTVDRAQMFKDVIANFGGTEAARKAAVMLGDIADNPAALAKLGKVPTTWSKLISAWKLGLISGPHTAMVVWMSHAAFLATRLAQNTMSGTLGSLLRTDNGIRLADTLGSYVGAWRGALDGVKAIGSMYKNDLLRVVSANEAAKQAGIKAVTAGDLMGAIKEGKPEETAMAKDQMTTPEFKSRLGTLAEMLTSKTHQAAYMLFRTANQQAEAYMQAQRLLRLEGNWKMGDTGYWSAVHMLANAPTKAMSARIKTAGDRGAFQEHGPIIDAVNQFKQKVPGLNLVLPFTTVPGSLFKEAARMSPFAPFVGQWLKDIKAGGEAQQRALVEWGAGTALSMATWYLASNGNITGAGGPTAQQRAAEKAAGVLPYSIYVNGRYYQYNRMQPIGVLLGLVADLHAGFHLMDGAQKQRANVAIGMAFANAAVNQTWMKGLSDTINALADPARSFEHYSESFVSSLVPFSGAMGQEASAFDPYVREVDSILDAVKNKIPVVRESLHPRYDIFGQPQANVGEGRVFNPIARSSLSPDKVRTEAMRLGYGPTSAGPVAPGPTPTSLPVPFPGRPADARMQLTDEQRANFAQTAGKQAYDVLGPQVNSPTWDAMPEFSKRMVYQRAFKLGRYRASLESVPPEMRAAAIGQLQQEYLSPANE